MVLLKFAKNAVNSHVRKYDWEKESKSKTIFKHKRYNYITVNTKTTNFIEPKTNQFL